MHCISYIICILCFLLPVLCTRWYQKLPRPVYSHTNRLLLRVTHIAILTFDLKSVCKITQLCLHRKLQIGVFVIKCMCCSAISLSITKNWMLHNQNAPCHRELLISVFLPRITLICCCTYPTCQIWLPPTFSCSRRGRFS